MTDSALKTFVAGEKVKASDTNSNNQYIISLIESVGTDLQAYLDQQIEIISAQLTGNVLKPGFIIGLPFSTVPTGYLACDGSSLLKEDYDDLYDAIGTTYGAADDYHFNIPDYQGLFLRGYGGNAATLGTKQGCGVPNVSGWFRTAAEFGYSDSDNILFQRSSDGRRNNGADWGGTTISFNASRCSSVYQNGLTEVRPDNMSVLWVIKY